MPDLLIELFSEEIPARMQRRAAEDLQRLVTNGLVEAGLTYAHAQAFSTPRRLVLAVEGLLAESPATREERKGPRLDAPQKALDGFLRSTGLTKDQLEARDDKKGQVWFAVIAKAGRPAEAIVAEVLEATIRAFPWPKSMRWGAGSLRWVRPLHSILCLLSDEAGARVVPLDIDGIPSGDSTAGHRFMAPARFAVTGFDDYETKLKRAFVLLRPEEREQHIWTDATTLAFAQGLEVVEDKALLAEVAGLVEWPVVLMGEIGAQFLDLPPEVLQSSMREHQKFFSVRNPKTGRIERFITVANRETADDGATILAGNQKVLAARLADAVFFWENDLRVAKAGMGPWLEKLGSVTFHAKLGTVADQIDRIAALAREIAPAVGADPDLAFEAAKLAKADLASEMVYEFPELQGVMGRYYAEAAGLAPEIGAAAEEHYAPLGPSDAVPTAPVSVAVALAEKLDKLTGFWSIDEKPTGSKDPFALRRAALGVIRLVLSNSLRFSVVKKVSEAYVGVLKSQSFEYFQSLNDSRIGAAFHDAQSAVSAFSNQSALINFCENPKLVGELLAEIESKLVPHPDLATETAASDAADKLFDKHVERILHFQFLYMGEGQWGYSEEQDRGMREMERGLEPSYERLASQLLSFFHDRLKVHLRDEGIRHDVIDAVLAQPGSDDLALVVKRAEALQAFLGTEDGANLVQGFKRANNILTQAEEKDGVEYSYGPDPKLAEGPEEAKLFEALDTAEAAIAPAMQAEDFGAAMSEMAQLRGPIDAFFEAVQINAENQILRRNRLNLLHRIRETCQSVADLSRIEG